MMMMISHSELTHGFRAIVVHSKEDRSKINSEEGEACHFSRDAHFRVFHKHDHLSVLRDICVLRDLCADNRRKSEIPDAHL